jgi:hypothetical protein
VKSPAELLRDAERLLLKALADYERPATSTNASEFFQLRLQAAIFQYELCRQVVCLWHFEPAEFALKVALKDIVHKLYEYDQAVCRSVIGRVLRLSTARGIELDRKVFKEERASWRKELSQLQEWSSVRNAAGGHYDSDIRNQVQLLQGLDRETVMSVAFAFMNFNGRVIKALAAVGRGKAAT